MHNHIVAHNIKDRWCWGLGVFWWWFTSTLSLYGQTSQIQGLNLLVARPRLEDLPLRREASPSPKRYGLCVTERKKQLSLQQLYSLQQQTERAREREGKRVMCGPR